MSRSDTYICDVDMKDGLPIGDGVAHIEKVRKAYEEVAKMLGWKCRLRFTARGHRGIKIEECTKAAVYLYRTK